MNGPQFKDLGVHYFGNPEKEWCQKYRSHLKMKLVKSSGFRIVFLNHSVPSLQVKKTCNNILEHSLGHRVHFNDLRFCLMPGLHGEVTARDDEVVRGLGRELSCWSCLSPLVGIQSSVMHMVIIHTSLKQNRMK